MVKLTEIMILKLAKSNNLQNVHKLNTWACNITDISILKKVPNLTIALLSANQLSSLADLSCCYALEELYIRRNNIQSLSELWHLKSLQNLRVLWLEGSPCTKVPGYRLTVLHVLPQLQRLDNLVVEDSEVELARGLSPFSTEVTRLTPEESLFTTVEHRSDEGISDASFVSAADEAVLDDWKSSQTQSVTAIASSDMYGLPNNAASSDALKETLRLRLNEVSSNELSRSQATIANILQAVLCLLSELDHDNLEAVSRAVRGRLKKL